MAYGTKEDSWDGTVVDLNVYAVVKDVDYEGSETLKIFADREVAKEYRDKKEYHHSKRYSSDSVRFRVEAFELYGGLDETNIVKAFEEFEDE